MNKNEEELIVALEAQVETLQVDYRRAIELLHEVKTLLEDIPHYSRRDEVHQALVELNRW